MITNVSHNECFLQVSSTMISPVHVWHADQRNENEIINTFRTAYFATKKITMMKNDF